MKHHHRIPFMLCSLCAASLSVVAQNTTNLPTSMYGIGELSTGDGGRYAGMGNIGIALNKPGFQNTLNPAAITRMDSTCFIFDVGASAAYARYSLQNDHSFNFTGNPNRLSIGFRILPRWYAMMGASPYSSVGYVIRTEEEVEGMPGSHTYSLFEGSGGLYRCYLTNAFALTRNLSVGVNAGIILGAVTQSETQEKAIVKYKSSKRAFYTDFGVHYESNTAGRQKWAAGLVFAPSLQISHDNTLTYSNSSTGDNLDKSYHSRTQYLPMHIGSAVSMTTERWVVTADYNYLDWSRNTSSYPSMNYENQHKLNIGGVYTTNPRYPRSAELMGGVGFSNSYINLRGGQMKYLEVSAGASFPIRHSYLSLGATWRRQINSRSSLMQESRFSVNLNLTFGERISRAKLR